MSKHEQPAAPWEIAAVLVVALALAVAGRAQAQGGTGVATYQVFRMPSGSTQLCPGEQLVIQAGVNQNTTRSTVTGAVPVSNTMPYAVIDATLTDWSIGSLSSVLLSTGGTPGPQGGFYKSTTFTATKIGQTTIGFKGTVFPNITAPVNPNLPPGSSPIQGQPVNATPAAPLTVTVACNYSISLYSVWRLPGERILDVLGVVQSAKLIPNANGRFSTTATMSSTAAWMGPCPGVSKIQRSPVTIYGDLGGGLRVKVLYAPASTKTTEGCMGRSNTGRGQPEPLDLFFGSSGGVQTPSHVLKTYVAATGSTTVVLKRIP